MGEDNLGAGQRPGRRGWSSEERVLQKLTGPFFLTDRGRNGTHDYF